MKTIIVATDFSLEAENAMEYAGAIARELDARIVLFNSYNVPIHVANSVLPAESLKYVADQNLEILKKRADKFAQKYSIEVTCECGLMLQVSEQLEALYKKYDASFIVMGMAAKSLAQDLFGNTTTSSILKHSYPVLAVPETAKFNGLKKILFSTDVLGGTQRNILEKIKLLAGKFGAEVEIFQVQESVKKLKEIEIEDNGLVDYDEGLEGVPHYYRDVESGAVVQEIENEIKRINADLLIMIPHQYGFWKSLIHRSKTRMMASGCKVPLFSIPPIKD